MPAMNNTAITAEAIAALKKMREELNQLNEALKAEIDKLTEAFETNKQGLGPHDADLLKLLTALGVETESAQQPVKKLVLTLDKAAMHRQFQLTTSGFTKK